MKFKRGDIVESKSGHNRIVFQLWSDARYDYYLTPYGRRSNTKSWWASGIHIGGMYKGTACGVFHLDNCALNNSFGLTKTLKEFSMTK
jgi:hypothetical protein